MTSLPIMWYACFDFEKKRKRKWGKDFKIPWDKVESEGGEQEEEDTIMKEGGERAYPIL